MRAVPRLRETVAFFALMLLLLAAAQFRVARLLLLLFVLAVSVYYLLRRLVRERAARSAHPHEEETPGDGVSNLR